AVRWRVVARCASCHAGWTNAGAPAWATEPLQTRRDRQRGCRPRRFARHALRLPTLRLAGPVWLASGLGGLPGRPRFLPDDLPSPRWRRKRRALRCPQFPVLEVRSLVRPCALARLSNAAPRFAPVRLPRPASPAGE